MKTIKTTYLTPECVLVDYALEGVLCASEGDSNNSWTIDDYEKVNGSWN